MRFESESSPELFPTQVIQDPQDPQDTPPQAPAAPFIDRTLPPHPHLNSVRRNFAIVWAEGQEHERHTREYNEVRRELDVLLQAAAARGQENIEQDETEDERVFNDLLASFGPRLPRPTEFQTQEEDVPAAPAPTSVHCKEEVGAAYANYLNQLLARNHLWKLHNVKFWKGNQDHSTPWTSEPLSLNNNIYVAASEFFPAIAGVFCVNFFIQTYSTARRSEHNTVTLYVCISKLLNSTDEPGRKYEFPINWIEITIPFSTAQTVLRATDDQFLRNVKEVASLINDVNYINVHPRLIKVLATSFYRLCIHQLASNLREEHLHIFQTVATLREFTTWFESLFISTSISSLHFGFILCSRFNPIQPLDEINQQAITNRIRDLLDVIDDPVTIASAFPLCSVSSGNYFT